MLDTYLLLIEDYEIKKYINFTPSQSKQENYVMIPRERYLSAEKDSFFSSFVLYTTKLFFGVADAHWFIIISANTDNKFRIQSEIFLIACNNQAIFLKLLSNAHIALLGRYEFQIENSIFFLPKLMYQKKGNFKWL